MVQRTAIVVSGLSKSLRCGLGAGALCLVAWSRDAGAEEAEVLRPLPEVHESWARRASRDLARPSTPATAGVSIVELPSVGPPGTRQRPRRALSVPSETPRLMLRSIGIEAEECSTRFRLPAKLRRDAEGGSSVQVQAHLGLACSF